MSAATTDPKPTGQPKILATYEADEGLRELVGQRVDGVVRITDRCTEAAGRAYLVEEGIGCMAELEAIVGDYLAKAKRLGYAPMQGWF